MLANQTKSPDARPPSSFDEFQKKMTRSLHSTFGPLDVVEARLGVCRAIDDGRHKILQYLAPH